MPTVNGVYYNLRESEYSITLIGIEYFFSSKFYLNKFVREYPSYRGNICDSMSSLFYNRVKVLCDVSLYRSIEKRGWYVKLNGGYVTWQELLKFVGENEIRSN